MKVAFLDRDGTLVYEPEDTRFPTVDRFRILPGVLGGLKELQSEGFKLVIVSNQSAGPGQTEREVEFTLTQELFLKACDPEGITFLEVFMCPHVSRDNCACKKPKTGMVDKFLIDNPVNLKNSIMIGDRQTDGMFAEAIGVEFRSVKTNAAWSSALPAQPF